MLNKLKHIVGEINCVRCSIVESGISETRMIFLKDLLEFNKFEVITGKEKNDEDKYTIGVSDVTFNHVFEVYDRKLKTKDGHRVSPAYWNQETTVCDPNYWIMRRK